MKIAKLAACAVILWSTTSIGTVAQELRNVQAPAEFPPSSFTGRQYVDSNGCVFIRAGISGNTTWVPRVTRTRQVICGQQPSLAPSQRRAAATTAPEPERERVVQISLDTPAPAETVAQVPEAVAPRTVAPAPKPVVAAPVARPAPVPKRVAAGPRCSPEGVALVKGAVCAPKVEAPAPKPLPAPQVAHVRRHATGEERIVPRHVYDTRLQARDVRVPKGYSPVWEDDRLNPKRAEQTRSGHARTKLIWTSTVPRRLIDQSTGRDVTAKMPLVYPYTDLDVQSRELGKVSFVRKDGKLMKRVEKHRVQAKTEATPKPRMSSRSAPKQTVAQARKTYVQAGVFGVPANAERALAQLKAAGLPAKFGTLKRGGKTLRLVVAGPFTQETAQKALRAVRAQGFRDAFLR